LEAGNNLKADRFIFPYAVSDTAVEADGEIIECGFKARRQTEHLGKIQE